MVFIDMAVGVIIIIMAVMDGVDTVIQNTIILDPIIPDTIILDPIIQDTILLDPIIQDTIILHTIIVYMMAGINLVTGTMAIATITTIIKFLRHYFFELNRSHLYINIFNS